MAASGQAHSLVSHGDSSEEQASSVAANAAVPYEVALVPMVPKVPIVSAPTCFLPRDAGEDQGEGLNQLTS